jgi:hypothetical protein
MILFVLPDFKDMGDFHSNLWGTAKLLVTHRSPYDIKQLMPTRGALWFPQIISAGFFLGYLEQSVAERIWICVNFLSYTYVLFSFFDEKPNPIKLGFVLLGTLLFPPLSTYVLYGQCALVFLAALLKSRDTDSFFSPFFLLIGLSKPQVGFIFAIWLFSQLWKKGRKYLLSYMIRTFLWGCIIMTPIFSFYPRWMEDFFGNIQNNNRWDQPALFSILTKNFDQVGLVAWLLVFFLAMIFTIYYLEKQNPDFRFAFIFAITAMVAPYIWSWDFVILFPIMMASILKADTIKSMLSIVVVLGIDAVFWIIRLQGPINDYHNWPIPILIFGLLFVLFLVKLPKANRQTI